MVGVAQGRLEVVDRLAGMTIHKATAVPSWELRKVLKYGGVLRRPHGYFTVHLTKCSTSRPVLFLVGDARSSPKGACFGGTWLHLSCASRRAGW